MSEQYMVRELANFLVSADKNDPSDPRHSQASAMLLRLEKELEQRDEALAEMHKRYKKSISQSVEGTADYAELCRIADALDTVRRKNDSILAALAKGQENGN